MSWTTSIDVAQEFASEEYGGRPIGVVWTTSIAARFAFAYINPNGEQEFVIDPRRLKNIEQI